MGLAWVGTIKQEGGFAGWQTCNFFFFLVLQGFGGVVFENMGHVAAAKCIHVIECCLKGDRCLVFISLVM